MARRRLRGGRRGGSRHSRRFLYAGKMSRDVRRRGSIHHEIRRAPNPLRCTVVGVRVGVFGFSANSAGFGPIGAVQGRFRPGLSACLCHPLYRVGFSVDACSWASSSTTWPPPLICTVRPVPIRRCGRCSTRLPRRRRRGAWRCGCAPDSSSVSASGLGPLVIFAERPALT